jgi:hypothetical protein
MARSPLQPLPPPDRLQPVRPRVHEAAAVKALFKGDATPEQQQRAVEFILLRLCGVTQRTFDPLNPHATAFAEGQRDIGLQLNGIRDMDITKLKQDAKENDNAQ